MEVTGLRVITYPSEKQEFKLYDLADIHLFHAGCAKNHFRRDIEQIRSEDNALVFVPGDYAEWISPSDPRWDADMWDPEYRVKDLAKLTAVISLKVIEELKPINRKILGLGMGNHEWQYMKRRSEMQVHASICRELGVVDIGYSAWTKLVFVHNPHAKKISIRYSSTHPVNYTSSLKVMTHHGKGAANTVGGKINSLRDIVDLAHDADVVMTGHLHEASIKPFVRLTTDHLVTRLENKICIGMATGSYLRNYVPGITSWGETHGFRLTTLGCIAVNYKPWNHTIMDDVSLKYVV